MIAARKSLVAAVAAIFCWSLIGQEHADRVAPQIATVTALTNQYPVAALHLTYRLLGDGAKPHPELPELNTLYEEVTVFLRNVEGTGRLGELYIAPEPETVLKEIRLKELNPEFWKGEGPEVRWTVLSGDALVAIGQAIVRHFNQQGIYAVWVAPHPDQVDRRTGKDLRDGNTDLTLVITVAEIQEVRTVARGRRFAGEDTVNRIEHARIKAHSPLRGADSETSRRGSLFLKGAMEDYLTRLNRFPGRRVDGALSTYGEATNDFGKVVADYIITEDRPWLVFGQISNTGTEASGDWRERFGYINQQLTDHDDILSLDYVTADFQESHAAFVSYQYPLVFPDTLKAEVYGSYGQYDADDIGLTPQSFEGRSWSAGSELTWSPFRTGEIEVGRFHLAPVFFDFGLGAKWQSHRVNNQTFELETSTDFLIPYANFSLSSISQESRVSGGIQIESNLSGIADTGDEDLSGLGRFETDDDWVAAKWGVGLSCFLEPLLLKNWSRLANEVALSGRGQYTFDNRRLPPQQQDLIGGFYSVRGYPEAFALGDHSYLGTAEYHFYLMRLLASESPQLAIGAKSSVQRKFANPFRFRAKDVYGRTQGEVMLRAFVDAGATRNNRPGLTEADRTLLSTGVGLEISWRRHIKLRLDYGIALLSEEDFLAEPVEAGDDRIHVSFTMAY